jgi:hypothetical protein
MTDNDSWSLGKLAVDTLAAETNKSGRGRAIENLSKLLIATPPRKMAKISNAKRVGRIFRCRPSKGCQVGRDGGLNRA